MRIAGELANRWRHRSARAIDDRASGPTKPSLNVLTGLSPIRTPSSVRSSAARDGVIGGTTAARHDGHRYSYCLPYSTVPVGVGPVFHVHTASTSLSHRWHRDTGRCSRSGIGRDLWTNTQ